MSISLWMSSSNSGLSPRNASVIVGYVERRTGTTAKSNVKVVSEILGHSSTRVTEDVYQHVSPGMQADATSRVERLLRDAR